MSYKLNGVDISIYDAIPIKNDGPLALTGLFDIPKRIGETEYIWGQSVEPFVDTEDIILDGRTLTLNICIRKEKESEYKRQLSAFNKACTSCTRLETDFDTFDVICKDEITVKEYKNMIGLATVKFYEPKVSFPKISIQPSGTPTIGIDNFSFTDFGAYLSQTIGRNDIGKRIEENTTSLYQQTQYREPVDLTLKIVMKNTSINELYQASLQFRSLISSPGLHTLHLGILSTSVYFKDGLQAKLLSDKILTFDLKCRAIDDRSD